MNLRNLRARCRREISPFFGNFGKRYRCVIVEFWGFVQKKFDLFLFFSKIRQISARPIFDKAGFLSSEYVSRRFDPISTNTTRTRSWRARGAGSISVGRIARTRTNRVGAARSDLETRGKRQASDHVEIVTHVAPRTKTRMQGGEEGRKKNDPDRHVRGLSRCIGQPCMYVWMYISSRSSRSWARDHAAASPALLMRHFSCAREPVRRRVESCRAEPSRAEPSRRATII